MNIVDPTRSKFDVLKEPRGFIKFIELFFAVCAFATTCDFSTTLKLGLTCSNTTTNHSLNFYYPFRINEIAIPSCTSDDRKFYGDYSSASQFYVFVGAYVLLHCLVVTVTYVVFNKRYETDDRLHKIDFVLSGFIVVLWFIASCIWADGTQSFKKYTSVSRIFSEMKCTTTICHLIAGPTYGGLNASLIFGFANVALWTAGLWFIWKETSWAKRNIPLLNAGTISAADGSPM